MLVSCLCLNILYTYMQCYHNTSGVGPCWEEGHHLCWDRGEPTVRRNQGPRVPWASLHILWGGQSSSRPHTYWSHVSSLWQRGVSWGTKSKWWLSTDIVCGIWSTLNTELSYNILYAIIIFLFVAIVYKKVINWTSIYGIYYLAMCSDTWIVTSHFHISTKQIIIMCSFDRACKLRCDL